MVDQATVAGQVLKNAHLQRCLQVRSFAAPVHTRAGAPLFLQVYSVVFRRGFLLGFPSWCWTILPEQDTQVLCLWSARSR